MMRLGTFGGAIGGSDANFWSQPDVFNHWTELTSLDRDGSDSDNPVSVPLTTTYTYDTDRDSNGVLLFSKVQSTVPPSGDVRGVGIVGTLTRRTIRLLGIC